MPPAKFSESPFALTLKSNFAHERMSYVIVCFAFIDLHGWKENTTSAETDEHLRAWPSGQQCLRCSRTENKLTFLCHDLLGFGTPLVEVPGVLRRPLRRIYIACYLQRLFGLKEKHLYQQAINGCNFIVDIGGLPCLWCAIFGVCTVTFLEIVRVKPQAERYWQWGAGHWCRREITCHWIKSHTYTANYGSIKQPRNSRLS